MAQKVFEGDVVFSILIDREKMNVNLTVNGDNMMVHLKIHDSEFYFSADIVKSMDFQWKKIAVPIACRGNI